MQQNGFLLLITKKQKKHSHFLLKFSIAG